MTARLDSAIRELVEAIAEAVRSEAATSPATPDRLYTIPETCEALGGIGRSLIYGLIARGELSSLRVGRRRLVTGDAIRQYIAERAA
jgi:excisionase family DNA binding protein